MLAAPPGPTKWLGNKTGSYYALTMEKAILNAEVTITPDLQEEASQGYNPDNDTAL
eukprot:SAG31_NODE_7872_length_1576_cov_26.500339_1_plen_56_part_00